MRAVALVLLLVVTVMALGAWRAFGPVHVSPREGDPPSSSLQASLLSTVRALPINRDPAFPSVMREAESLVGKWLADAGYRVLMEPVPGTPGLHNVIAWREGGVGRKWLLGAHLDAVVMSPGADDNGSGVAIAVEVARMLAGKPAPVIFAFFTGEETGLLGSRFFAEHMGDDVAAAIVMDVIGYTSTRQDWPVPFNIVGRSEGDFVAAITQWPSRELSRRFTEHAAPGLSVVEVTPPAFVAERIPDLWRSDHAPFWRRGIPSLFLTDTANFRNPNYHRPTDTVDTLDAAFMARVARTLAALLLEPPPDAPDASIR